MTNQGIGVDNNFVFAVHNSTLNNDQGALLQNLSGAILSNDGGGGLSLSDGNGGIAYYAALLMNQSGATLVNDGSATIGGVVQRSTLGNTNGAILINDNASLMNQNGATLINDNATLTNQTNAELINDAHSTINNMNGATLSNSAQISNFGQINNSAAFRVTSTGIVSGTGGVTQTAGITTVDGSITQSVFDCKAGVVNGGGTISTNGSGNLSFNIERDCAVQPFHSIGTITLDGGAAGVYFDGELDIEIAGLNDFDILKVIGGIHFGADARIKFYFEGYTPNAGDSFDFLQANFMDFFNNIMPAFEFFGLGSDYGFQLVDMGNGRFNFLTEHTPTNGGGPTVPEPATLLLVLLGMGLLGVARRQRVARTALPR